MTRGYDPAEGRALLERQRRNRERLDEAERRNDEAQRKLRQLEADRRLLRAERVVDQAIKERRIEKTDRDLWVKRHLEAPETVTAVLNDLNPMAAKILYTDADTSDADREVEREFVARAAGIRRDEVI